LALTTLCRLPSTKKTWRHFPVWGSGVLVVLMLSLGWAMFAPPETAPSDEQTVALVVPEVPQNIEPREIVPAPLPLPVTPPQVVEQELAKDPPVVRAAAGGVPVAESWATKQRDAIAKSAPLLAATPEVVRLEDPSTVPPPPKPAMEFGQAMPLAVLPPASEVPVVVPPAAPPEQMARAEKDPEKYDSSFYGIRDQGERICYVVDNSASMRGTRFTAAIAELKASVEKLKPEHQFYVVFFSDGAYPLFFPKPVITMIPATDENKALFREWLGHVALGPATKGSHAMKIALDLEPNIIYMLGDGEFQDNTVQEVVVAAKKPYLKGMKLHAVGFDIPAWSKADYGFAGMAKAFGGTYRNLRVAP
jgi:hypothetical protein